MDPAATALLQASKSKKSDATAQASQALTDIKT